MNIEVYIKQRMIYNVITCIKKHGKLPNVRTCVHTAGKFPFKEKKVPVLSSRCFEHFFPNEPISLCNHLSG